MAILQEQWEYERKSIIGETSAAGWALMNVLAAFGQAKGSSPVATLRDRGNWHSIIDKAVKRVIL